jgi:hypothetical protein
MVEIDKYITENGIIKAPNVPDEKIVNEAEKRLGINFGPQLKEYLIKYGFLSFKFSELYGINSNQKMESDLISQTEYLHKYYPKTDKYIAIENQGEGDYFLVADDDDIYEYDTDLDELSKCNMSLFEYIVSRFDSIR